MFKMNMETIVEFLKRNRNTIIKWAVALALLALGVWGLAKLVTIAVNYIAEHKAVFGVILAVLACLAYAAWKHYNSSPVEVAADLEREAAKRTYLNIAPVILALFIKLSQVYPFASVSRVAEIFSPAREQKNNGIWIYQYALVKCGEIDINAVLLFLKDELMRMLFSHENHGLAHNLVSIEGVEYPALAISDVKDVGTHILVDVAVMSKRYYFHMNHMQAQAFEARAKDSAVEDDEFI
jgi:hypothetical protein